MTLTPNDLLTDITKYH